MDRVAVQEPSPQLIKEFGVPVHPIVLRAGARLGAEEQRGRPVGEPDRCQGPVRQAVILDHCVTGREHLIHHHGPLRRHRREGALVPLRVNPFHGHGRQLTSPEHEHLLSRPDLAGENRRHPRLCGVLGDEEEVRGGEGHFLARLRLDDVEDPAGGRVPVYEHDEVGVNRVSLVIRGQNSIPGLEISDGPLGAILQGDRGGSWEAAA